jgi:membrane protease YdiL (CAAX protease family)
MAAAYPRFAIWWRLALLGLVGVASMLLAPLEQLMPLQLTPIQVRLLALIQPSVLVLAFAALGVWLAPKVGLDAPLVRAWAERGPIFGALRRQLPAAIIVGLGVAAVLLAFWAIVSRQPISSPLLDFQIPLAAKLLYGGIVEELMLRWGVMSFLVWASWRLAGRPERVPAWCVWTGLTLAALLFAAGHVPLLLLLVPDPAAWLIALVLVGNSLPGMLFGWLFWRHGLEAAMIAHALAHLFATIALSLT